MRWRLVFHFSMVGVRLCELINNGAHGSNITLRWGQGGRRIFTSDDTDRQFEIKSGNTNIFPKFPMTTTFPACVCEYLEMVCQVCLQDKCACLINKCTSHAELNIYKWYVMINAYILFKKACENCAIFLILKKTHLQFTNIFVDLNLLTW